MENFTKLQNGISVEINDGDFPSGIFDVLDTIYEMKKFIFLYDQFGDEKIILERKKFGVKNIFPTDQKTLDAKIKSVAKILCSGENWHATVECKNGTFEVAENFYLEVENRIINYREIIAVENYPKVDQNVPACTFIITCDNFICTTQISPEKLNHIKKNCAGTESGEIYMITHAGILLRSNRYIGFHGISNVVFCHESFEKFPEKRYMLCTIGEKNEIFSCTDIQIKFMGRMYVH